MPFHSALPVHLQGSPSAAADLWRIMHEPNNSSVDIVA
jgi:hypothetical protein